MSALTVGELFAGYGGIGLGLSLLTDVRTAWVADVDKGACKVLARRFPDAPNLGDVTAVDWDDVEPVDVLTGGSPCQDLSVAGQRAGMRPGTRSGLWESMAHAIHHLQPSLVVWENVQGALSAPAFSRLESGPGRVGDRPGGPVLRGAGRVLGDLATLGYDAQWQVVSASDVGAPHRRERIFVLAHRRGGSGSAARLAHSMTATAPATGSMFSTPSASLGSTGGGQDPAVRRAGGHAVSLKDQVSVLLPTPTVSDMGAGHTTETWEAWTARMRERHGNGNGHGRSLSIEAQPVQFGAYADAVRRWEAVTGTVAPSPTEPGARGNSRLAASFVEWMMGLPDGWVTSPDIGLSRAAQLRMLGNGVVPQQAAYAVGGLAQWAVAS
jgi:DNA (cytosine-5)-methyltransferase 1